MEPEAWQYRVESVGSWIRGPRDGQLAEMLDGWAAEGWELVCAVPREGTQAVTLIARRRVTRQERRRRTRPGEGWAGLAR